MIFSLITATVGRVKEVQKLCDSLSKQSFKNFELYIVDQNDHHLVENIIKEYESLFVIHYIRSNQKGLSLNRNIALKQASGEIFGFPDDDCFYSTDTLEKVYHSFLQNPQATFIATSTQDSITKQKQHFSSKAKIYKKDILQTCISYNIFVKKNPVLFDERLGVGTYFSSGEETDYLYSLCNTKNSFGIFCDKTSIFHPTNNISLQKIYAYSLGFAALQKKDWIYRHNKKALFTYIYFILRAICGMLLIKHFHRHKASFMGKIVGFIKFKP